MKPYAELLEFNQPNPVRKEGFTRIRDAFPGLNTAVTVTTGETPSDGAFYAHPERIMEFAGRWDYGENNARKLGETSKVKVNVGPDPDNKHRGDDFVDVEVPIIQKYISMGHESMIEMGDATFFIECSRVVSHELVRHRIASFQQESQRFVKYVGIETDDDLYWPDGISDEARLHLERAYDAAGAAYMRMRDSGVSPQLARYALPNGFRTRLIMKTNIREWRHIIRLRLDKSAQPEMQELVQQIYDQLVDVFPNAMHGVLDNGRGVR